MKLCNTLQVLSTLCCSPIIHKTTKIVRKNHHPPPKPYINLYFCNINEWWLVVEPPPNHHHSAIFPSQSIKYCRENISGTPFLLIILCLKAFNLASDSLSQQKEATYIIDEEHAIERMKGSARLILSAKAERMNLQHEPKGLTSSDWTMYRQKNGG